MNFTNVTPTITVVKTNDADGDTTYTDSESIGEPGGTVPFKATIKNNSTFDSVNITTLADAVGSTPRHEWARVQAGDHSTVTTPFVSLRARR